ncbi:MAG TPA: D-alanyl-D-alanine carboxypeptidase family protein [Limnochordia bacterium]|nr:D-alanyl-D-alanine carboxypeptidase family protein [Limnochordia bacterium]
MPKAWIMRFVTALLLLILAGQAWALEPTGRAAYLMDPYSGRVFLEKESAEPLPVASISKLMTLVLILEAVDRGEVSLEDVVTASPYAASKRGSRIWLEAGEQLPLGELVYAIAVGSANDAAVAVAEYLSGSEESFVELMNQRAQELGLTATRFVNCTGLPEESGPPNVMSAQDAALLARHALTVPRVMDYVSTYEYTMRADTTKIPVLWNANKLLRRYYGVDGMKTGFTTEAGYCMVATAQRDNLRLIAVTLGHKTEGERESAARALLDYGFRNYQSLQLYAQGTAVSTLDCPTGSPRQVDVVLPAPLYITVERGKEVDFVTVIRVEQDLKPPIRQGQTIGTMTVLYQDEVLGTSPLTVAVDVSKLAFPALVLRLAQALAQAVF